MTAASMVVRGRELAATIMPDTVTITRGGGELVFDPETGDLTPQAGTTVYSGPGRLRTPSAIEREVLFGETQVTATRFAVSLPHDAPDILIDDVVTVDSANDPHLEDRTFRVIVTTFESYLMYREIGVELVE